MKTKIALAATAGLALSGCAGYSRVTEYPAHLPRNYTVVHVTGGRVFTVKEHPRDVAIMIQPTIGRSALAGLESGLTFGAVNLSHAAAIEPQYREAAEKWAAAHGCQVDRLYAIETVSYEATLKCPPGDGWR